MGMTSIQVPGYQNPYSENAAGAGLGVPDYQHPYSGVATGPADLGVPDYSMGTAALYPSFPAAGDDTFMSSLTSLELNPIDKK